MSKKIVDLPISSKSLRDLNAGDQVLLTGHLYTARDAAHKRMIESLEQGDELPFNIKGETIFYVGPTPAKPGQVIGSAGPTTSYRMDPYTSKLLDLGLKGMIGKGYRSQEVIDSIAKNQAIYFSAIGGTAALISKSIKAMRSIAYEDLGPEGIYRLEVENFPAIVVVDARGNVLEAFKQK